MVNKDFFPWDQIPETDVLEAGDYLMRGKKLEDLMSSGEGKDGTKKRMFKAQIEVMEPKEAVGAVHFENYTTGTVESPEGIIPGAMGTKQLKKLLGSAQLPAGNSIGQLCRSFEGSVLGVTMTKYADEEGMYKDVPRNRIIAYWKVGERTPRVFLEGMEKGKKGKGAAAASQAAKMATQIPVAPIAPQASQAAPPPLPPQVAPSALGSAMPPPGAQTVRMSPPCSICGTVVPMSEFGAHVAACAAAQG